MPQLTISKCSRYAWAYLLWGKVFGDTYQRSIVFAHAFCIDKPDLIKTSLCLTINNNLYGKKKTRPMFKECKKRGKNF